LSNLCSDLVCVSTAHDHWYALSVRLRREQVVASILQNKGYCVFLPTFRSNRRWSDRVKQVNRPLFPGYVFCQLALSDSRPPIVTTPGVIGFVSNGNGPAAIPHHEIDAVKKVCASDLPLKQWQRLIPGSIVRIGYGPLTGVDGTLVQVNKRLELVVSIMLLQRAVSVRISPDWVVATQPPAVLRVTPKYDLANRNL
jgi:transcription antitermination factor NusG